jgi:hypothetical protein
MNYTYTLVTGTDIPSLWSSIFDTVSETLASITENVDDITISFLQTLNQQQEDILVALMASPPLVALSRNISKLQFRLLFTFEERVALDNSTDPIINTLRRDLASAEFVDLDSPLISQGLDLLIYKNIILYTRKAEILA